jgi:hypothetical protein
MNTLGPGNAVTGTNFHDSLFILPELYALIKPKIKRSYLKFSCKALISITLLN